MEASALYFLGRNLGHETLTICAVLANRFTQEYSKNYTSTINQMIEVVLKRIC